MLRNALLCPVALFLPGLVAIESTSHGLLHTCPSGILSSALPPRQTILPKLPTCLKLALYSQCLNALHPSLTLRGKADHYHLSLAPFFTRLHLTHTYTKQTNQETCLHMLAHSHTKIKSPHCTHAHMHAHTCPLPTWYYIHNLLNFPRVFLLCFIVLRCQHLT